jgi:hypothetical protein
MTSAASRHPGRSRKRAPANIVRENDSQVVITESTVTCPKCGHQATEKMQTDACQFFYNCRGCGKRLKPKLGDCCVYCSYGSIQGPIRIARKAREYDDHDPDPGL